MPINNFKLFDEKKANMMSDDDYAINQQRLNGVQSGVASSQLQNKTLYQTALMCYALAQIMAANGYDANDADAVSTFVNNLSSTMVQKVKDRASELEVKTGAKVNKYITPGDFMTSLNYLTKAKYGESDPTTSTEGTLGQIYVNTTTQRAFYCGKIEGSTFTWYPIARIRESLTTQIVTSSGNWIVPQGVTEIMVVAIGGGGFEADGTGGAGGYVAKGTYQVKAGDEYHITIGEAQKSRDGAIGNTSFGSLLTANGADKTVGGSAPGYSNDIRSSGSVSGGSGISAGQFGGSGACGIDSSTVRKGGNGGEYGGGGGGATAFGGAASSGGAGGTYGGKGGDNGQNGSNGTNTIGMGLDFEGQGLGGKGSTATGSSAGGGGGGYGGNGSDGIAASGKFGQYNIQYAVGGSGGGYGADAGKPYLKLYTSGSYRVRMATGGGGGYGGKGGDGMEGRGGYGGGYGKNNYGAGGRSGCVAISYKFFEVY